MVVIGIFSIFAKRIAIFQTYMRKYVWGLLGLLLLLTSCSESKKIYKIGVSQCSAGPWRDKINNEMLAAQHLYDHDVKVSIVCAYDDTKRQIHQIDSMADAGIDLLVVAPNEAEPTGEALARIKARGIPVICFDRTVDEKSYTAFMGGSNVEAGHAIGVNAIDVARGISDHKPFVMEITALMSSSPAQERHKGFAQAMQGHDEVEYVCREGDWSSETPYRIMMEQIRTGHLPDIVFCHNDGMATGVYRAVAETKTEGRVKIFGIDGMPGEGLEYVQLGHQLASYVYPTGGAEIIKLALDILTGKPYKRQNTLDGILVVRENAWSIATTSKELLRQNKDLVTIQDKLESYLGLYNIQHKMLIGSVILIVLLMIGVIAICYAYYQTRRTIRQRQSLNEEETLLYTHATPQPKRSLLETPEQEMPVPRSQDVIFAEELNEAIRQKMGNPNLKMDDLGESMGLSRVQLYRKVKAITGLTPIELLRKMRLQQGYVLLCTTTKTVQEIAYEVGFGTPGYFSKCFKQQYGKYPMDLRQNGQSQQI